MKSAFLVVLFLIDFIEILYKELFPYIRLETNTVEIRETLFI